MASALVKKIEITNSMLGSRKSSNVNCVDNLPENLKKNKTLTCGVLQALEAFRKGKSEGQIQKEVFIFNDFNNGGVMGKMWFLNADGAPANVVGKNPIWVSRGRKESLGGTPPYLDQLKKGLLKDGGVMFTTSLPKKSNNKKLVGLRHFS